MATLKEMGYKDAQLYGADSNGPLGGLNAFFLLLDKPSTYDLPEKPLLPQRNVLVDSLLSVGSALLVGRGRGPGLPRARRQGRRRCLRRPDWHLLIVWYFFLGGIAGGAYFTAAIADNFGSARDRGVVPHRLHPVAAADRALRHPAHPRPRHAEPLPQHDARPSSSGTRCPSAPGCSGSSALFAFVSSALSLRRRTRRARRSGGRSACVGTIFGFFLASYTGVLLSATALPFWSDARLMGALFLASGASTGMAAISLLLFLSGESAGEGFRKVKQADRYAIVFEIVVLAAFLVLLGGAAGARSTSGPFAPLFWGGLVVVGLVIPLLLDVLVGAQAARRWSRRSSCWSAASSSATSS